MQIVSIEKTRSGSKFKIRCDEGGELVLSKEVIVDYGLRRGDDISDAAFLKIRDSQLYHDTYVAATRLLNYRMRTRHELVRRLRQKKLEPEIIDRVVDKLSSLGLIDDSRFAEAFIAEKISSKPVGRRELERKLHEKGVSRETAQNALSTIGDEKIQVELALKAAASKLRSLRRFDTEKRKDKLTAFLAGRGFDWDTIKKVIRETFPEGIALKVAFGDSEKGDPDADSL